MDILSIANCPAEEHLGSGYVIANFVNGLRAAGHRVDLFQPDDYEVFQPLRPKAIGYRQAIGMLINAKRQLKRHGYDIVEFWGGEAWAATEWLLRRQRRPLVVQHTNGPEPRHNRILREFGAIKCNRMQAWHMDKLLPKAFGRVDGIVTVSQDDLAWLAKTSQPRCGNRQAVEVPLPDCFIGRPLKPRATRIIGFCGSWLAKKGIGILTWDISRILREFPDWRFVILGTNAVDSIRSCFPNEIRGRVEVLPMVRSKHDLARLYERIEILVQPSISESFGVALAEGMACGCAAVASRVGFGASLKDGEEALVLARSESPYLYQAVKRLITDRGLRFNIGAAGRQRVQNLRWDRAIKILACTYEAWLTEHSRTVADAARAPWRRRVARLPRPERI